MSFSEALDQLAMTDCVRWFGHGFIREDGHVLRGALEFEVEGQLKKWRLKGKWIRQVMDECAQVGLIRED